MRVPRSPTQVCAGLLVCGLTLTAVASASERCEPVRGKIANTFIAQDGSRTLGVVTLRFGKTRGDRDDDGDHDDDDRYGGSGKLKCALFGQSVATIPGRIAFIHTISCEDAIRSPLGPVHSSIWLNTVGVLGPPENAMQVATFEEVSTLIPEPNAPAPTGVFKGTTTNSQIRVKGAVYKSNAIDMKFEGEICKPKA